MSTSASATPSSSDTSVWNRGTPRSSSHGTKAVVARPFSLRGFTSMLLAIGLIGLLLTGFVLFIAPRGRFANWNDWSIMGLDRQQWISLHINASIAFAVLSVIHLFMNWSRLVGYLKRKSKLQVNMKRELAAAIAIAIAITLATVLDLTPISLPMQWRGEIRNSWEQPAVEMADVR